MPAIAEKCKLMEPKLIQSGKTSDFHWDERGKTQRVFFRMKIVHAFKGLIFHMKCFSMLN